MVTTAAAKGVGAHRVINTQTAAPRQAPRLVATQDAGDAGGNWIRTRMILFLLLSALPLLAISAHVFGVVSQSTCATLGMIPLAATLAAVVTFAPHPTDGIIARGLVGGMVACLVYDAFRLFTVHVLGWMGDFIPTMGTWVTGDPSPGAGAVVGYMWRYLGDGGGLGVAFYVLACTVGLGRWLSRPHRVVLAAVFFAVFPVWSGLIATVAFAARGEELLFHLTPATVGITLVGHLIFGFVLGVGFLRARRSCAQWSWPPPFSWEFLRPGSMRGTRDCGT